MKKFLSIFLYLAATLSAQAQTKVTTSDELAQALNGNATTIIVNADFTLETSCTVKSGVTLIIPYSSSQTKAIGTTASRTTTATTPSAFRKLTVKEGATLTVNGNLEVSAQQYDTGQGYNNGGVGVVKGPYGQLLLEKGSAVVLNSGAKLTAWGYVTGKGEITAKSGATVYEDFQILDWKGGTNTSNMLGNSQKVFPICQYYIQNIESPITYEYGAYEKVSSGVVVSLSLLGSTINKNATCDGVAFLGKYGDSNTMFLLKEGASVRKEYDAANDRIIYTINGDAAIGNLSVTMKESFFSYALDSSKYILPFTNNMTMNVASGTTSLNANLELLPGAQLNIAKGATAEIPSGKSLYLYDVDQWDKYCFSGGYTNPVAYSPSWGTTSPRKGQQTNKSLLSDAKMNVEGTLTVSGSLYTTSSGANICSTTENAGKVCFNAAAPAQTSVYQWNSDYVAATANPAWLHNGDGSYVETNGATAQTTYCYSPSSAKWMIPTTGDVNLDGKVSLADVCTLAAILNGSWTKGHGVTDINNDGNVNLQDVDVLVSNIFK